MNATANATMNAKTIQIEQCSLTPIALAVSKSKNDDRTFDFMASDETPIIRYNWWTGEYYYLIFDHGKDAIDLTRVNSGACMFTEDHWDSSSAEIGKVMSANIKEKQLLLSVKMHPDELGERYLKRIENGTQSATSIGALPKTLKVEEKAEFEIDAETGRKKQTKYATLRATEWELMHYSAVSTPAIPTSGKLSYDDQGKEIIQNQPDRPLVNCTLLGDPGFEFAGGNLGDIAAQPPVNIDQLNNKQDKSMPTDYSQLTPEQLQAELASRDQAIETLNEANIAQQTATEAVQEQITLLQQSHNELRKEAATEKRQAAIASAQTLAEKLYADGKLEKAEYDRLFSDEKLAEYAAEMGDIRLDATVDYLTAASGRQPILATRSPLNGSFSGGDEPQESEQLKQARTTMENAWKS